MPFSGIVFLSAELLRAFLKELAGSKAAQLLVTGVYVKFCSAVLFRNATSIHR